MKMFALVCTLNEARYIEKRIANLRSLEIPPQVEFEIHVIDNGSTDGTTDIAREASKLAGAPVTVHCLAAIGKCGSLFWAFEHLKADFFVLTDANTVFGGGVLAEILTAILRDPAVGLISGNTRAVRTVEAGDRFLQSTAGMPARFRIARLLGICAGANGGCYCVKQEAVQKIWEKPAVRNDDFIISAYCISKASFHYAAAAKAYEVENFSPLHAFRRKYRDALGHHQAVAWVLRNGTGLAPRLAAIFRLVYWGLPILAVAAAIAVIGVSGTIGIFMVLLMSSRVRFVGVRGIGLYAGYLVGVFRPPPARWLPLR